MVAAIVFSQNVKAVIITTSTARHSMGYPQSKLNAHNLDNYLMSMAKEEIKSYVEERMPFEYQKSFSVLDKIKRRGFALAD